MINRIAPIQRIAVLSVHTSPLAMLGGEKTGGMNVYIRDFSRELARRGVAVDIFTRRQNSNDPQIQLDSVAGVRVIHIEAGTPSAIPVNEVPRHLAQFTQGVLAFASNDCLHYDLIHAHYWLSGIVAEQLRAMWGIPFVQMFHTLGQMKNQIARSDSERAGSERLEGELRVVRSADQLIAATSTEQKQLVDWYRADAAKIVVIPPGVDLARFQPINKNLARDFLRLPREMNQILFTGRIEPLKGIDALIEAIGLIQLYCPHLLENTQVSIIGGDPTAPRRDPEMVRLQELRCRLDLCDTVRFLGAKEQADLPLYYAAADMVVMPSHYESFGLVALEAMAMGTPVIASDVGGLAHLVKDGETGYLVPHNNPKLLAARISDLLLSPSLRTVLGKQAAIHARSYEWKHVVDRMLTESYQPLLTTVLG